MRKGWIEADVCLDESPAWPALVRDDYRWNGWVVPSFDRATAHAVAEWVNTYNARFGDDGYEQDWLIWHGEDLYVYNHMWAIEDGGAGERVGPDSDGRYAIGAMSWCWSLADEGAQ